MNPNYTRPIVALALRALSDLAAVPLLVFTKGGPPAAVGPLVAALGVLTAAAAIGLARNSTWARPLAWTTRIADVVAALPAFAAGDTAVYAAATVTIALSIVTIVLLIRDTSSTPTSALTSASRP